jgi:hypothetical protein
MKPTWNDLTLNAIDLHVHAGTDRRAHHSLLDIVDFSIATGRRFMALTDHFGRFLGEARKPLNHYEGTLDGFRHFAADVRDACEARPDVYLLFAPEINFKHLFSGESAIAFGVAEIDCVLGEPGAAPEGMSYGDYLIRGIEAMARLRDAYGVPSTLVHPLRRAVCVYCCKAGPGPKYPLHPPFPPLDSYADPVAHVEELLDIDIGKLAEALIRHDVPLELNESDWWLFLGVNHESFFERYMRFYRELLGAGVHVVLGSDMHNIESPLSTPFAGARMLGLTVTGMTFLRHWLGPAPE